MIVTSLVFGWFLFAQEAEKPSDPKTAEKAPPAAKTDSKADAKTDAKTDEKDESEGTLFDDVPTVVKLRELATQPYKIQIWLTLQNHPSIGPSLRTAITQEIRAASERYMGGAWILSFASPPPSAPVSPLSPIEDMPELGEKRAENGNVDKVIWADVSVDFHKPGNPPYVVSVREFDFEFNSWGPSARREIPPGDPLPNAVFRLIHRQFRANIAVIGLEPQHKMVRIVVRGAALQEANSPFPILAPEAPVKVTRDILRRGKFVGRATIPWTYLIMQKLEPDRRTAICAVKSAMIYPIDAGMLRRTKVMGFAASNSENAATEISFHSLQQAAIPGGEAGRRPAAGYEVLLQVQNRAEPLVAGSTDRRGRITVSAAGIDRSGENRPLVADVILRIGKITITKFPIVPGDEPRRDVRINPDPLLPDISGRVDALTNQIVDTLARQQILLKRLNLAKGKLETIEKDIKERKEQIRMNDLLTKRIKELAVQINALPDNKHFQQKLEKLQAEANKLSKEEYRQTQLSPAVKKLFAGVEKLLKEKNLIVSVSVSGEEEEAPPEKKNEEPPSSPAGKK